MNWSLCWIVPHQTDLLMFSRQLKEKSTGNTTKLSSKEPSRHSKMTGPEAITIGYTRKNKPWMRLTDVWSVQIVPVRRPALQVLTSDSSYTRSRIRITMEQPRPFWVIIHSAFHVEDSAQSVNCVHPRAMLTGSRVAPSKLASYKSLLSRFSNKWRSSR